MNWSLSLGSVNGTALRVHATFFLLLAWVAAAAWVVGGAQTMLVNVAFILGVFGCVLLHELGHAAMARRFGILTPDITLLPIGGMARLERIPEDPWQEILIAVAGPAVNVVIWIVLALLTGTLLNFHAMQALEDPGQGLLARLAAANLILVVFNMIPAFPMDGGRVFRAALALYTDRADATRIAAHTGQTMAFLLGFWGLSSGNPLLLLIAVFVFFAAQAESTDAVMRSKAHSSTARDAMITAFETLSPTDTMSAAAAAVLRTTQSEFPVVDDAGHPAGFLTRDAVLRSDQARLGTIRVAAAMTADIPTVSTATPMSDVLDTMQRGTSQLVAVTNSGGQLLGYINRENIGEWVILSRG